MDIVIGWMPGQMGNNNASLLVARILAGHLLCGYRRRIDILIIGAGLLTDAFSFFKEYED